MLSGVVFKHEKIIQKLDCVGNIMLIDCNYGHKVNLRYEAPIIAKKKFNHSQKSKKKIKKMHKYQNDDNSFNSQIFFSISSLHLHQHKNEEDAQKNVKVIAVTNVLELVTKLYKIKVFCNDKIMILGILTEDMSDVTWSLEELTDYLSKVLTNPVSLITIKFKMNNYKCQLLSEKINMYCL